MEINYYWFNIIRPFKDVLKNKGVFGKDGYIKDGHQLL